MREDDRIRLRHMLDAAREASGFIEGRKRDDLDTNRMLALALVRAVEIIGEAGATITPETQTELPTVPWREIVGMRNRLIHAYFDVDEDILWSTVKGDLPPLISTLEEALQEDR
jgi:uncharacterized protein with HEPN domain